MDKQLKIVHCANFSYFKNGEVFYATDRKVTHGLMSQGHFVYDFSYRDQAKAQRFLGFKKKSVEKANQDLIETCKNIEPDVLLLAKAENIYPQTLKEIKKHFPNIKIIKWFVDFLERENKQFFEQFKYIDSFFATSAEGLQELSTQYPHMLCAYMPNITDMAFDKKLENKKEYDVIYVARDHKEDVRHQFAVELEKFCKKEHISLKLYASLGNPPIFGNEYYKAISKAKIAINFNRTDRLDGENPNKLMSSSDRMNHFMGTGTCTFSPVIKGLDSLYKDNEDIIYFKGMQDCFEKIKYHLHNKEFSQIATNGNKKVYQISNTKKVTSFILELTFEKSFSYDYEWKSLMFQNGEKLCITPN